ncbi:MAG: Zn-ribbon domain-containing OB-fold protein [Desertimonas sp.]
MGSLPDEWALPEITAFNEAWFTSGTIAVQVCTACGTRQHPPEEICHRCGSMVFDTEALAPSGTVHSFTVVHHPANPALAEAVPYTVVLVALDDDPDRRVVGSYEGPRPVIGQPVRAVWHERTAEDGTVIRLPSWIPTPSGP